MTDQQDKIAAEKKSIGFDYQFLFFIYTLLGMKIEETIGYEVKDDVHLELSSGQNIFMQLKHSLEEDSKGNIINLTEKDIDLWKTLYNWIVIIKEKEDKTSNSLEFILNTKFLLVTNKECIKNAFFVNLEKLVSKSMTIEQFVIYMEGLYKSCKGKSDSSDKLRKYLNELITCDKNILSEFLKKVALLESFDDIEEKLTNKIIENHVDERKVKSILAEIVGTFDLWKFSTVKNKKKIIIKFKQVNNLLKPIYKRGFADDLPRNNVDICLPDKLEEQKFIQELLEIEDLEYDDVMLMTKYTTYKLRIMNLINDWIINGYINETDKNKLENDIFDIWIEQHRGTHKKLTKLIANKLIDEDDFHQADQSCVEKMRNELFEICKEHLSHDESNGMLYCMSDEKKIGWKYEWRCLYKCQTK